MKVVTKFHGNLSNSCGDRLPKIMNVDLMMALVGMTKVSRFDFQGIYFFWLFSSVDHLQ